MQKYIKLIRNVALHILIHYIFLTTRLFIAVYFYQGHIREVGKVGYIRQTQRLVWFKEKKPMAYSISLCLSGRSLSWGFWISRWFARAGQCWLGELAFFYRNCLCPNPGAALWVSVDQAVGPTAQALSVDQIEKPNAKFSPTNCGRI